ncbi:hypothetical protein [Pseudomonas mohnii]
MSIKRVMGRDIGMQLCKILGLDPGLVADIKLNLEPFSVATVEVTRVLTHDEADALVQVVEQYDFIKRVPSDADSQPDN